MLWTGFCLAIGWFIARLVIGALTGIAGTAIDIKKGLDNDKK